VARFVGVAAFATASPTAHTLPLVAGSVLLKLRGSDCGNEGISERGGFFLWI